MWDEIKVYLENIRKPYELYVNIPINETNGLPNDFEWEEYVGIYDDLKIKLKKNESVVTQHYLKYGKKEQRLYKKQHYEAAGKVKKFKDDAKIYYTTNVGMDIGGFLQTYKYIGSDTDLILKIHTKKCLGSFENTSYDLQRLGLSKAKEYGEQWFKELMNGVAQDPNKVDRIIKEFEDNDKCGMVGYKKYNNYKKNSTHIQKLFDHFSFAVNLLESFFVGGTIFWVRKDVLDHYLTHDNIEYVIDLLNPGYSYEPSFAHAMERMFAYFVYDQKQELVVID
jgi:lipopolysaccharide biosynthesis protein